MISLNQISKSIPEGSRFCMSEVIIRQKDRVQLQSNFHYSTSSGGVSGSKFADLHIDSTEEEVVRALLELKAKVTDYFITTQKIEIRE